MSTQIDLLKKYGLPIRGHSGQHLLIDPNMQRKIVDALDPGPKDKILEIGPGLGALTEEILKRGSKVWAVEKDKRFIDILEGEFGKEYREHLILLHKDILEVKLNQKPFPQKTLWKVVSNLPYYITAPILLHLIEHRPMISTAILMMQKEVARRLVAAPGSKDYGRLTLAVRYAAEVRHLFDVPPTCFTPRPEVDSSVVELTFHPNSKMPKDIDEKALFYLIQLAFSQRRKTLLNLLTHDSKIHRTREELQILFESMGLNLDVRGESLLLKDFLSLTEKLGLIWSE